ncbi:tRNA splicing endonuclease subunit [Saccharomycopsis crataegensis]|uniref:tRNA splicing endonuclease subunit n=1 Tax=Saccharomycopsis crataegensis TaxID=43959 RepID=A0AAV5QE42_9ASCO|nr:tRNA splicing endonuclease subunit [Saccharomycopsis crataegensis]
MIDEDDLLLEEFTQGKSSIPSEKNPGEEDEDQLDDEIQDWGSFLKASNIQISGLTPQSHIVPKRGDKGFEPTANNYDNLLLQNKRDIMYATIGNSSRGHHHKNHVEAFWSADASSNEGEEQYAVVPKPKGSAFNSMGIPSSQRHIFLNFEEILYLVERGSVDCYLIGNTKDASEQKALPMNLQMCYSAFLKSSEDYDMFYVYSYLKRYGYVVRRATEDIKRPPTVNNKKRGPGLSTTFWNIMFKKPLLTVGSIFYKLLGAPLLAVLPKLRVLLSRYSWSTLYESLYATSYGTVLDYENFKAVDTSKFKIVYNLWKPNNHQKANTPPDFQVIIVNTNLTSLPTVDEIKSIFKKCYDHDRILIAILDNGMLNFIKPTSSNVGGKNAYLEGIKKQLKRKRNNNKSNSNRGGRSNKGSRGGKGRK